jgi:DNA-binding transcriptional regulator YiaG
MVEGRVEDYDASAIVGFGEVFVHSAPALVCDRCGHVMFEGWVVEAATRELARLIVRQSEDLRPDEIRFLREVVGMTQAELAERLGVSRATVNRWETSDDSVGPVPSLALRTLAAWSLDDADLAREIGAPRRARAERSSPPYQLGAIAA